MDYYLNTENSYQRLKSEYDKYGSIVVAYDFDNTVFDYHGNGWKFEKTIDLIRKLKAIECFLIVFTANEDETFVKQYLTKNGIPFDVLNENPPFYESNSRKIYYNILLDDRAGMQEVFQCLTRLVEEVEVVNQGLNLIN